MSLIKKDFLMNYFGFETIEDLTQQFEDIIVESETDDDYLLCNDLKLYNNLNEEYMKTVTEPVNTSVLITKTNECKSTNINELFENYELININFNKCVTGYHLINSSSINETIWEDINSIIFSSSGIEIYSKSEGSHLSGMDINCSLGKISNKSAKYSNNKKSFDISSYRLTTVCSNKKCGSPNEIIEEINRRKNFDYYSFIIRDESDTDNISYDWLLIPSNYLILDPSSYSWQPTIGKRGKNKDTQVGWNTNTINGCKMSITFSMSSQLWIHIEMREEVKQFIIARTTVKNKPKYNYINLLDKLNML
jgi:hypothetical protein